MQTSSIKRASDILQRKATASPIADKAPPIVHEVLQSGGKELDAGIRSMMEPHFGHDFSRVRVHTDAKAAESARAVNASAYTVGQNVVFNTGQYAPGQQAGRHLLAHELTHVVQQSATANDDRDLRIGEPGTALERDADSKADQVLTQARGARNILPGAHTGSPVLQRQTPAIPSPLPPLHLSTEEITIDTGEALTAEHPKLVALAASFKQLQAANPRAYIKLSTYLSDASKMNSAKADQEKSHLQARMIAAQHILSRLGVPAESIEIESATAFSSKGGGQVTASLYKSPRALPPMFTPGPVTGPATPASTGASSSSLGDLLSFKFKAGPLLFAVELPKSVAIKLPLAISAAKTLSFELKAESSGEFGFTIALNGLRHINISAKAALKVDKDKGTSGSAGLEITTTKTVCSAPSPESLKAKITSAGEKLTKIMKELETAKPEDRIMKLADIAGAIGEMYDAVDKAKGACKEVPIATFNFGLQGPLGPKDPANPNAIKDQPFFIGGSATFRF